MTEHWLPVPGYEGSYEVSDLGRARSLARVVQRTSGRDLPLRERVLRPVTQNGYSKVGLYKNNTGPHMRPIHRLVMEAFVGPCPQGLEVRHLDGDSTNNQVSNLAYGTHSENVTDSVQHGTHPAARRTHCIRGHEFDVANTYWHAGRRSCRACGRRKQREYQARVQARMASAA